MRRKYQRAIKGRRHGQETEIAIYFAGETMLASVQPAKFTSGEVHQGCWKNIEERLFIDKVT
jgi:hypothetical protein